MDRAEAAHARAAQGQPRGVLAHQAADREHVVDRLGAEASARLPVTARVERNRRHVVRHRGPREVEVALLGRACAVADDHSGAGLDGRQEQRVGQPVARPELRPGREGVLHTSPIMASVGQQGVAGVSHVYPLGSRIAETGRLEVGGCDVIELAERFGTPAYVYAEEDIRARARTYVEAFRARTDRFEVVYASKAFPCTPVFRLLAEEGLSCDVASGGELYLALRGGFPAERLYLHGNNKSEEELRQAVDAGVGHIVVDSFDELDRLERMAPGQRVLLRVTPGITPSTHAYISTGQVDSKFGFGVDDVPRAVDRIRNLELVGLHAHLGSQIFDLAPFERLAEVLAGMGDYPLLNLGGGLGIAYTADDRPPAIEDYVDTLARSAPEHKLLTDRRDLGMWEELSKPPPTCASGHRVCSTWAMCIAR